MKLLFIDLETTGTDFEKNGIVQIAGTVKIDGAVAEEFNFKCDVYSDQAFDPKALQIIGKTREEIGGYPAPRFAYKGLFDFFDKYLDRYNKNDKFFMVGQNPRLDCNFLAEFFKRNGNPYFHTYVELGTSLEKKVAFTVGTATTVPD